MRGAALALLVLDGVETAERQSLPGDSPAFAFRGRLGRRERVGALGGYAFDGSAATLRCLAPYFAPGCARSICSSASKTIPAVR